jgi:hypothetical protein
MNLLSVWLRLVAFHSAHASKFRMALSACCVLAAFCVVVHAQDANAVMNPPTNSSGAQQVANEAISWVYIGLKTASIIMLGIGIFEIRKGQYAVAVPVLIAAVAMFFPPAIIKLAQYLAGLFNNGTQ